MLRFFKRGINKVWYIDDRFPWDHNNQGVFCQVISDGLYTEIWPLLLEKAYAKIHKHYEVLRELLIDPKTYLYYLK